MDFNFLFFFVSTGNYSPRQQYPGNYGPPPSGPGQPPSNSMQPGQGQYQGRPLLNHVQPHSQFPYQPNWGPPQPPQQGPGGIMPNHVQQQGKGGIPSPGGPPQQPQQQQQNQQQPPPQQQQQQQPGGSPRTPMNYLKQHLQHKGSYSGSQSPTPPQGYGNGPGMHPPMAPPGHHMGPPMGPTNMGPPSSTPQNPPPTGLNSHPEGILPPPPIQHSEGSSGPHDNGVNSPASQHNPVTSIITTGPDGSQIDEASQQSTLSNASGG